MGCNESKSGVATGNTTAPSRKPAATGAAPIDDPRKVEESAAVPPEEKGLEGGADIKVGAQDAAEEKKSDAAKEDEKEKPEKIDVNVNEEEAAEEKEPEKEDGAKEVAKHAEGSTTNQAELALTSPTPMAATETADPAVPKQANPPENKE
ncbi:hypothetical protein MLD38_018008 [Melastoma candidum]|uniref:Uncharacterized protein n=1 Tax=Melastoma candidum TaxID=119954 RepID=A0ACB9QSE7_9MYRT|nr:hypothetical protein MLD38_018008 [Melastoma candidum]